MKSSEEQLDRDCWTAGYESGLAWATTAAGKEELARLVNEHRIAVDAGICIEAWFTHPDEHFLSQRDLRLMPSEPISSCIHPQHKNNPSATVAFWSRVLGLVGDTTGRYSYRPGRPREPFVRAFAFAALVAGFAFELQRQREAAEAET